MKKNTLAHFALVLLSSQLLMAPAAQAMTAEKSAVPASLTHDVIRVFYPVWRFSQSYNFAQIAETAAMPLDHNGLLYVVMEREHYKGIGVIYTQGEKKGELATFIKLIPASTNAFLREPLIDKQLNRLYVSTSQGGVMAFDLSQAPDISSTPQLETQLSNNDHLVNLSPGALSEEGQLFYNACVSDNYAPNDMLSTLYWLDTNLQLIEAPQFMGRLSGTLVCHDYRDSKMGRPVLLDKQLVSISNTLGANSKQYIYDLSEREGGVVADSNDEEQIFKSSLPVKDHQGRTYYVSLNKKTLKNSIVRRTGIDGPLETFYTGLIPDKGGLEVGSTPSLYLVNDILYIREKSRVTALDINQPNEVSAKKWVYNFDITEFTVTQTHLLLTKNGTLYAATNRFLHALDSTNGSVKWMGVIPETTADVLPGAINITPDGTVLIAYISAPEPGERNVGGVYAFAGDGSGLASGNAAMTGGDPANSGRLYPADVSSAEMKSQK